MWNSAQLHQHRAFKDRLLMNDILVPHLSLSYPKDARQPSPPRLTCTTCRRFMRLRDATICQPAEGLKSQPETLRTSLDAWMTQNILCSATVVLRVIYVHYVSSGILEPLSKSFVASIIPALQPRRRTHTNSSHAKMPLLSLGLLQATLSN